MSVVGILSDEADPMVSVMKVREGFVAGPYGHGARAILK